MWGHYMVWALREWSGADPESTSKYVRVTQWLVLAAILLHPALISYRLSIDGLGLPPDSLKLYAGQALAIYTTLGLVCLLVFVTYEFKQLLIKKPTVWRVVRGLNHVAMFGIILHSLKLGSSVRQVPLKYLWPAYGVSLALVYIYLASKKKLV
jgi:hypothetical protein